MPALDPPAGDSTRVGPYRMLRELGRGGQAIVWLAEDSRSGRQVATRATASRKRPLEPDNAFVWLLKARFYSDTPMPERGVAACKKALELDPALGGVEDLLAELEARVKK